MKVNNYLIKNGVKVLLFYLFTFLPLHAQDSLLLRNYQFVKQQDPWLTSSNAAGLTRFNSHSISEAEVSLSYATGGLTTFGGASNVLQADASVESFYRISRRAVVYGHISYDNWTGRNMTGSVFMPLPSVNCKLSSVNHRPFDIVEQTEENPGKKHRDTYRLVGAFGYAVSDGLAIGMKVDYTAANYAKYKDLRHSNKLMDLQLSVGATAPVLNWLTVGANYIYHRQTESVTYHTFGKSDRVYLSLIDYGAFMGRTEQYGSTGYTDNGREMPLVEDLHGGSLQLEFPSLLRRVFHRLSLFAAASYQHGTGYYGRKSPYTITYTHHQRDLLTLSGRVSLTAPTTRHFLDISYSDEKLKNFAENYRELKNEAGSYYYQYSDPTETADKHWHELHLDYTLHLGIRGEQPTWTIMAGYHWQKRDITAYLYPYYRRQLLTTRQFSASAERNIIGQKGVWTIALNGAYQKGTGDPFEDGTFTTPSTKQAPPATMEAYLWQDYHLLTSPQYQLGMRLGYAFCFPGTRLRTHASASLQHRHSTTQTNEWCGRDHTTATIAIGCTF